MRTNVLARWDPNYTMRMSAKRRGFLVGLAKHGPFTRVPDGVPFPGVASLHAMSRAGLIVCYCVGPERPNAKGEPCRSIRFAITSAGRHKVTP